MFPLASKLILPILAGLFIIALASLLIRSYKSQDHRPFSERSISAADIGMEGVFFVQTHNGQTEWKIEAKEAAFYNEEHKADLKDASIFLAMQKGLEARFTGDEGEIDTRRNNFRIFNREGDIEVRLSNGFKVLARALEWNSQSREIGSEGPVTVLGPRIVIKGLGFRMDTSLEEFKITGNVRVTLRD